MKFNLRQILLVMLFGVLLYGGFVVYAGYQDIKQTLSTFRWWTLVAALGLACFNYGLRFLKWQYYLHLLRIEGVAWFDSLLVFLSGFVLTVTPGKLGEVFKSAVLSQTHGVEPERSAPIVIAERLTDVIAVVLLILLGSSAFAGGLTWALLGSAAVGLGLLVIFWQAPSRWVFRQMQRSWLARIVPKLETALTRIRELSSPRALVIPTLLSVVGWAAEGVGLFVLLRGFGAQVPLLEAVFFYTTATLAGALVPVPGGLGVTEALIHQQLMRVATVSQAAATSSMLMIRLATLWWAVVIGFLALGWLKLRFPRLLASSGERDTPSSDQLDSAANAAAMSSGSATSKR